MSILQPGQRPADPYCGECYSGWIFGDWHGLKQCPCRIRSNIRRQLERIPPEYRHLHLENITPDRKRHPKQALVWRAVKENPDGCYLICGPSGAGKSAVMWALYRWAVLSSRPAVAMSLAELIEDYRQAEIAAYEDEYVPALPLSSLQAGDDRWFIGIDDFHIAKPTRFAGEATYRLLNAIYSYQHQLVVTSQCDKQGLQQHWNEAGEGRGIEIMRRVLEIKGATYLTMFQAGQRTSK
jgi:hypothetical protein